MSFKNKYLKYKNKYINLKNQIGGTALSALSASSASSALSASSVECPPERVELYSLSQERLGESNDITKAIKNENDILALYDLCKLKLGDKDIITIKICNLLVSNFIDKGEYENGLKYALSCLENQHETVDTVDTVFLSFFR